MLLGHAWVGVKNTKKSGTRPAEESGHDISVYESGHDISVHATCRRPGRGGGARSECKRGGCPCMMLAGRGVGRGGGEWQGGKVRVQAGRVPMPSLQPGRAGG